MPDSSHRGVERARWLSDMLDRKLIDPLLGLLLPGIGDAISSVLGLYLIFVAWQQHHSRAMLARMLINLGIDSSLGVIPIVGDVFDFTFQANRRNLALLERPPRPARNHLADTIFVGVALLFFLTALSAPLILLASVLAWAF